jgi:putative transposase
MRYSLSMNTMIGIFRNLHNAVSFVRHLLAYLLTFLLALLQPKAVLAARILALQSQLATCKDHIDRKKAPKPKCTEAFRLLWVIRAKFLHGWQRFTAVMKPATVVRWHKGIFRRLWRWKSRPGRPRISRRMQALIRGLSKENPLWGGERIRQELLKLGYDAPDADTVRKYMAKPTNRRGPSGTWLAFLRNHLDVAWAIDFCTVTTIGFKTLYVFVVLEHGRRKIRHWVTTYQPSMQWTIQQLKTAMPYDECPRYMHRDNDGIYGLGVPAFLECVGVEEVPTAYRSPWQNPFVERFFGTLRRELLDHVIPLSQSHLDRLLGEFIERYYHIERPHQGLDGETPVQYPGPTKFDGPTKLVSIPILGGLHHRYERVAA